MLEKKEKSSEQKEKTKMVMFYVMQLVGFKPENILSEELQIIIDFIGRTYPRLKAEEIKQAFEMGVAGELDVNLQTYQNFNTLYVSNVIQSYKRKLGDLRQRKKMVGHKTHKLIESSSDERKMHFSWILNEVYLKEDERNGKKGSFPDSMLANWKDLYLYLVDKKEISEIEGEELGERLEEIKMIERMNAPVDNLGRAIEQLISDNSLKVAFYRNEVKDWFISNREKLIYEN